MKYTNPASFRQALDQHINRVHNEHGLSHAHLRKLIVFDRFLARLLAASAEGWVLKGGVALNLRWQRHARTTKDLDLARRDDEVNAREHLLSAATIDLDDFFTFKVERTAKLDALREGAAVRYHVTAHLAGRRFDTPHAGRFMEALTSIFDARDTHPIPDELPRPPADWVVAYRRLAVEVDIPTKGATILDDAHARVASFLRPIFARAAPADAIWDPDTRQWSTRSAASVI